MTTMWKRGAATWFGAAAIVVAACGGSQTEPAEPAAATAEKPTSGTGETEPVPEAEDLGDAQSAPAGEPSAEADADQPADESAEVAMMEVGIPACDEYISKYLACVEQSVPEEAAVEMKAAFEQSAEMWREAAEDPEARDTLAATCRQALSQAEASMSAYDCDW